jgi:hypothetical protein
MGDGITVLFGAPVAHEDHALRACYAALRMQESVKRYGEAGRGQHGVTVEIRVGLNSGEVVVRAIGGDLQMDYTAVGHTTHLAARMEQLASPGRILITSSTLELAEGHVAVTPLGPVPVKGLATLAALGPWLGRHQTGDHRAYTCLDVDLDWLAQLNAATLARDTGLIYSEFIIDGVRVWVVTEVGVDTTVLWPWERARLPLASPPPYDRTKTPTGTTQRKRRSAHG